MAAFEPAYEVTAEHLRLAREAVAKEALVTAVRPARALSDRCGRPVFFKCENEQWTGAFKVRGALARLSALQGEDRHKGVVAASAGNHALGIGWACRRMGIPGLVVLPETAPRTKQQQLAELMVKIRPHGRCYDDAEIYARELAVEADATFVSPFDDPWVIAGNGGSIAYELQQQLPDLGGVVVPVGGGGLASGLGIAFDGAVPILGVNTSASPAMAETLDGGQVLERYDATATLAEGLEGGVSVNTAAFCQRHLEGVTVVDEEAIAHAIAFMAREERIVTEGSAAVAVAAVLRGEDLPGRGPLCVIITGRNIDQDRLRTILA